MSRPRSCYIALFHGVHTDEKTVDLAAALGVSQETAVGHLAALWLELMAQRGSDSLDGVSDLALAQWGRWTGDASAFAAALRACKWIKIAGDSEGKRRAGKAIASGWHEANGRALKELDRKRRYYRRLRDSHSDGERTENGRRIDAHRTPVSGNPTLPYPTRSDSDPALPSPPPPPPPTGELVGLAPDAPPRTRKPRTRRTATPAEHAACERILARLNDLTGHHYRPDGATLALVAARLADRASPLTEPDLLAIVEDRVRRWSGDPKMREHLRPSTLFRPSHVGEYLSAARQTVARAVAAAAPHLCRKCQQPTNGRIVEGCHRRCYYPDTPELWGDEGTA